ncbi:MAG: DUF2845 domain-containing protein [Desulfobacterales bacterium]|nr:MAG: DUF2845 domain-containing protein [Desulfobacterales bacterium]
MNETPHRYAVWIYNFGPTKLVHRLTFFRGRLERIQTGDYGSYHSHRPLK